jgi:hypothetical protein
MFILRLMGKPGTLVSSLGLALVIAGWWIAYVGLRENAFAAPVVKYQCGGAYIRGNVCASRVDKKHAICEAQAANVGHALGLMLRPNASKNPLFGYPEALCALMMLTASAGAPTVRTAGGARAG